VSENRALELLSAWPSFAERDFWRAPGRPELGCYGTGYNSWGVQTNQKYVGAMAVLATDRDFDVSRVKISQEAALERALAALRYSLATHHTGDQDLADGTRWGRTWISALGVERMMHGVEALAPYLTDADRADLCRVLTAEADHQLQAEVVAGVWGDSGRNQPESNIWNGAICARAALMYPDEPHAGAWTEKAHRWLINGISVPSDAADGSLVAGRPVSDRHIGPNFFPHYSLDHHTYLNVGYMVICLSNIAMFHYARASLGEHPFPSLYHHADGLWGLVKRLIFGDGRLCRIGGDTRQRYCYCQDYLLPVLIFAADYLKDAHAPGLLAGQLDTLAREQEYNADGSFLSRRLGHINRLSPYYYTRLESDKAVVLSMVRSWLERLNLPTEAPAADFEASVTGGWEEPEYGAVFHRSPARMVSFAWRAAEGPMGLCLPPDDGHLAEWKANLTGEVHLLGAEGRKTKRVEAQAIRSFPGGFLTVGRMAECPVQNLSEGWSNEEGWITHHLAFAALPDGHTTVRLELASLSERRAILDAVMGVKLEVPNDLFNRRERVYHGAFGRKIVAAHEGEPETLPLASHWVNVADRLGVIGIYGADGWTLVRRGKRIGGYAGSILTDALCYPARVGIQAVYGPAVLLDTGCLLFSGMRAAQTKALY